MLVPLFPLLILLLATCCSCHGRIDEELRPVQPPEIPTSTTATTSTTTSTIGFSSRSSARSQSEMDLDCFHVPEEVCKDELLWKDNDDNAPKSKCRRMDNIPEAVVCCNVTRFTLLESLSLAGLNGSNKIRALHVRNATMESLDLSEPRYKQLTSISITDGNITKLAGEFTKMTSVTCLNVSNNNINSIEPRALSNLYDLVMLDLSHNNLTRMPNFRKPEKNFTIDIMGNDGMLCKSVTETMNNTGPGGAINFNHVNETFCASSLKYQWFNSTEMITLRNVLFAHQLESECKNILNQSKNYVPCTCQPSRMDMVQGRPATLSVGVDCSYRKLTSLPEHLPPNTYKLNITGNNITSLSALNDDPIYQYIRELIAKDNQIESISELEGTKFMDNFVLLDLSNNALKTIHAYILSNSFDRNNDRRKVFLGGNRLHCDCNTAKVLKVWLLGKRNFIPDYNAIECGNSPSKVIDLAESKMCQSLRDWTDYIYYIIAVEVMLLVCLILKVTYDYWIFKTAGYLPWPANKMPKLPCDWLCET
ncbi:protein halfway isoform X2 [Ctenocephalides felis]|nr:protein halfway isoform X2 [Ctenocephalides felis]XP_026473563.1 protein halfway isoform X2 [Ctenocephalides felis]